MLIAASISRAEIDLNTKSSFPHWRQVIDSGLKHRNSTVQEAAAAAMSRVSALVDCSSIVRRFIKDFRAGSPSMQQSLARLLGALDYSSYDHALSEAIGCLLESVDKKSRLRMSNVEARRNCMVSIPQIIANMAPTLPSCTHILLCSLFLLKSLDRHRFRAVKRLVQCIDQRLGRLCCR